MDAFVKTSDAPSGEPSGAALAALAAVTLAAAKLDFAAARTLVLRFNPDGSIDAAGLDESAAAKVDAAVSASGAKGVSVSAEDILAAIPEDSRNSNPPPLPVTPGA